MKGANQFMKSTPGQLDNIITVLVNVEFEEIAYLSVKRYQIKVKSFFLNVIFINFIKRSNTHHLQPSLVYTLLPWGN